MRSILHSQQAARDDVLAHLADNLRRRRHEKALSQGELAARAGLSRRMISAIEGGAANVSLSTVDKLSAALGIKFTDLVRPPDAPNALSIESVGWRGNHPDSIAVLLGAAPGSRETELWRWSLAPGERYGSEYGSEGWHEVIYVISGTLKVDMPDTLYLLQQGQFRIFSSKEPYTFVNDGDLPVVFIRAVVL